MCKNDFKKRLIDFINDKGVRTYARYIKNYDLYNELIENTSFLPNDTTIPERAYVIINNIDNIYCSNGNRKKFNTFVKGYRFCANNCQCRRDEQSKKISEYQRNLSDDQRKSMQDKAKQTTLERYGVDNVLLNKEIKEQIKKTNLEKYGSESPFGSEIIKNKIKKTNTERYGVEMPLQSKEIRDKGQKTMLEKYDISDTMEIARRAFKEKNGKSNPFELKEYQNKAKQTMLERYGVEYALQDEYIFNNMLEKNYEKYGVFNSSQININKETLDILQSKEKLEEMSKTMTFREISIKLDIYYGTVLKYADRHGLDTNSSSYELSIGNFIKEQNIEIIKNDRKIIAPFELDIVVEDLKLAIEFCGIYWHSEKFINNNYHLNKLKMANDAGYRLITIFEDEWINQNDIVKNRLLSAINKTERGVFARKTIIKKITYRESKEFLNMYHLQGGGPAGFANYGAYYNNELIAVMTFSKGRLSVGNKNSKEPELLRFATNGKNHPGIGSKLFSQFMKDYSPDSVISYADRRWSDGNFYNKIGFDLISETKPNYWYVHPSSLKREHRFNYRKNIVEKLVIDGKDKTEKDIMTELGYNRIWDCGSLKFRYNK